MSQRSFPANNAHAELSRRLDYEFSDPGLLVRALTHRSKSGDNYERLEFLGDSVLSFAISAALYERFPDLSEGELTRLRARLVKKETLAALARKIELGGCLALGGGELKSGGFDRDSILADALEAVFGAVYRDRGIDHARAVIVRLYRDALVQLDPRSIPKDPKTALQEHLQKHALPTPVYTVIKVAGESHNQQFVVACHASGLTQPVHGEGSTRRHAEQQAAAEALRVLVRGSANSHE